MLPILFFLLYFPLSLYAEECEVYFKFKSIDGIESQIEDIQPIYNSSKCSLINFPFNGSLKVFYIDGIGSKSSLMRGFLDLDRFVPVLSKVSPAVI